MRTPVGVSRFVCLPVKVSLLACVLPVVAFPADAAPPVRAAVAAPLPRYEPSIREKYLADQAASAAAPKPAARTPAPALKPAPTPVSADGRIVLDPIVVYADRGGPKPPPPLPRVGSFAPLRDLKGEPFESGPARDARLVKKHYGAFGEALSRLPFFGPAMIAGARDAEAQLTHAQDLNSIVDSIDLATLAGQDPEITRKTRDEYLKLYYSGPQK
jgi:hypothetical protein